MQSSYKATSNNNASSKFIKTSEWDVQANRYMQPRITDKGLKMVSIISNQRNKKLHIQLPNMLSWGIEDFTDQQTGESDGKFKIKLHFRDDSSEETKEALAKLQAFEEQVIKDAIANSEAWFGKKQGREIIEHMHFPFLKCGRNKETRELDPSKGYYFAPKVNCYDNKWDLEVFDVESKTMVFPSEDDSLTPMDFIAKGSEVTCGIECKSIWLGAKGWGISWALKQCVVKPKSSESSEGLLQLDVDGFKSSSPKQSVQSAEEVKPAVAAAAVPVQSTKSSTYVEDSEDEEETKPNTTAKEDSEPESEPEAKVEEEEEEKPKVFVKKTVVKKADDSTVAKKVSRKKV
jgi:hypothetical protein